MKTNRLNANAVARAKTTGMLPDGGGLYLQVSGPNSKNWLFRYTIDGRTRAIGLGSVTKGVTLAQARAKRDGYRDLVNKKIDPLESKDAEKKARQIDAAKKVTFAEAAAECIEGHKAEWRSAKHRAQWESTLRTYAYPEIGDLPVSAVTTEHVLKCLQPIWDSKLDTATRLRGRIETVLDWAKAKKFRDGENPARLRGNLDQLLSKPSKLRKLKPVIHHPALPYAEIGAFMVELRKREGISAAALEFTILTATRTGEVLGARWDEIDHANHIWIIPGDRMKSGKEHRAPLSPAALAVLERMRGLGLTGDFIFPNIGRGRPLSNMSLLKTLERMGRPDLTTHGFRSTFRDWAAERTNFQNEVIEMALAHAIGDKVEAAYRRGDLMEKRRRLMDAWAQFCAKITADTAVVVSMRA
jgi:integrase